MRGVLARKIDRRVVYVIVIITGLFLFFFPKYSTIKVVSGTSTYCKCLGFEKEKINKSLVGREDHYSTVCYGIPHSCIMDYSEFEDLF